jgi:CubicO group peptidase (beta-lactamase class C family)
MKPAFPFNAASVIRDFIDGQPLPAAGMVTAIHGPAGEDVHALGPSGHGDSVRADTRFYFGSFTKVLTAALVGQLVDESRLVLDDEVAAFVPLPALAGITVRQLLSHTSGLIDLYEPATGVDAIVAKAANAPRLAAPGMAFSYTNAGYAVLGRLIEELTGRTWEERLSARLLTPLGIYTTSSVDESRLAQGHQLDQPTGLLVPAPLFPDVGDVMDAAGGRLKGTADDAARLARAILRGRVVDAVGGEMRILSEATAAAMRATHVQVPGVGLIADAWGLGWSLLRDGAPTQRVHGHIGASSVLVVGQAEADRTQAVLTNFATGASLGRHLVRSVFGVPLREFPVAANGLSPASHERFAGRYGSVLFTVEVQFRQGELSMTNPLSGAQVPLRHLTGYTFLLDAGELLSDVTFLPSADGRPGAVHVALRLLPRLPD